MPAGGTLSVKTCENSEGISVEIADSGTGIAETDRQSIFDPFFSTKAAGRGTGLGLAVCYGIVTAHGGRIEVARNLPAGTKFSVILPVSE